MVKHCNFKKIYVRVLLVCMTFFFSERILAAELTATQDGRFRDATTWGGTSPQSGDVLIIPIGIVVGVVNSPYAQNPASGRPVYFIKIYGTLSFSDPGNDKLYLNNASVIDIYSGGVISTTGNSGEIVAIWNGTADNIVYTGTPTTINGPAHATASTTGFISGILPVKLTHFSATRSGNKVSLQWSTATENNNKGFELERKMKGSEIFETIAFIASQAKTGNSAVMLNYEYSDANSSDTYTQYRLKQVDLDGKIEYSDIRIADGTVNKAKTLVYPNPSKNGATNLIFNSNDSRNIRVLDNNGRLIKQFNNYINHQLKIDGLHKGSYIIHVMNNRNNQEETLRLVISNY